MAHLNELVQRYQQFISDSSWYAHAGQQDAGELGYLALGLAGETGEAVDAVKKIVRMSGMHSNEHFSELMENPVFMNKLVDELSDVAWYFFALLSYLEISLEELLLYNTYKLVDRIRTMHKEGRLPEVPIDPLGWPYTQPEHNELTAQDLHEGFKPVSSVQPRLTIAKE